MGQFMVLNKGAQCFILMCFLLVASVIYLAGIDGRHIPKNGDEEVYLRITRLTALQGHWLPLQSDLTNMRNTKPPLLFWQGLMSSQWGKDFRFERLRYPNVIYSLLTAILIAFLATQLLGRVQQSWIKGAYAGLIWLGFWTTFRYGRPFLTAAPEVFWMFSSLVILLAKGKEGLESRLIVPVSMGLFWGLGLLTKSFALVIPAGIATTGIYLMHRDWCGFEMLRKDGYKLIISGLLSLGLFGLWFLFDSEPEAIWREFVMGENVGKLNITGGAIHYLKRLLWGHDSIISLLAGFLLNTGLFLFPAMVLFVHAGLQRKKLWFEQKALWLWIIVWFLFFSLPDSRSARYLMPAMPCLAILLVLSWDTFKPWVFKLSHGVGLILILAMICVDYGILSTANASDNINILWFSGFVFLIALMCSIAGIMFKQATRHLLPFTVFAVYASLTCLLAPINASHFSKKSQALLEKRSLAVPSNFRADHESYQFDFPTTTMVAYVSNDKKNTLKRLLDEHQFVIWRGVFSKPAPSCAQCKIIDSRLEFLGRQDKNQFKEMLEGKLSDNLVTREWLIQSTGPRQADSFTYELGKGVG